MFGVRLADRVREVGSPTCVGLDPHLHRLPFDPSGGRIQAAKAAEAFCRGVIDAVAPLVAAVKPQVAFFEALGAPGWAALEATVSHARAAGLMVILDAKRGDIGSTAEAYAHATLDDDGPLGADAVTLSPYLGPESLEPFWRRCRSGKGIFVLVRTSNPGSGRWQHPGSGSMASAVAAWVRSKNAAAGALGAVGAVVGSTLPESPAEWRDAMPRAWFLVPGLGPQGGNPDHVRSMLTSDGTGALVLSARGVLFPTEGRDGADWQERVAARAQRLVRVVDDVHRR